MSLNITTTKTYSSVKSDGEDFAGVVVVADLVALLEVPHLASMVHTNICKTIFRKKMAHFV